jgi:hypothetical protein
MFLLIFFKAKRGKNTNFIFSKCYLGYTVQGYDFNSDCLKVSIFRVGTEYWMVVVWCLMPLSTIFYRIFWKALHKHCTCIRLKTIPDIAEILLKVALNTIKQPFQNLRYRWNIVESGIKHHKTTISKSFQNLRYRWNIVVLWCLMPLSTIFHLYRRFWNGCFMVFNATFNNISAIS